MLIVTTDEVPGHRVPRTLGLVRGITVRSRNLVADAIGGLTDGPAQVRRAR